MQCDGKCSHGWRRWARRQEGLTVRITRPEEPPRRRMVLVRDYLAGHYAGAFVRGLFAHGIMPLSTLLGGSWRNMAESIQRIRNRRALAGQPPRTPEEIIAWLDAAARGEPSAAAVSLGQQAAEAATASPATAASGQRLPRLHPAATPTILRSLEQWR